MASTASRVEHRLPGHIVAFSKSRREIPAGGRCFQVTARRRLPQGFCRITIRTSGAASVPEGCNDDLPNKEELMKRVLLVLAAGILVAATDPKDDLKKMQGTWQVVGHELGGKKATDEQLKTADLRLTIDGN